MASKKELFAKPRPNEKYRAALEYIAPYMNRAVKVAEGNPNNFGVLSESVGSPSEANRVLDQSIVNNFWRWLQSSQADKFVDFMQQRWAPLGAANDPNNLNANWATNVRKSLKKQLGADEYERWKRMNLVQAPWGGTYDV